ncbi:MAG: lysophospholipid acyltransferase family protein, partial [Deltaproteobacteria bacterium]|nr:lysophospholipid acyltransferase family protein [Deltaproteobacteria bacterium]
MTLTAKRNNPFSLALPHAPRNFPEKLLTWFRGPLERILGVDELARLYDILPDGLNAREFIQESFALSHIQIEVAAGTLENIPATGPVIVVANHPYGGIEGMILAEILASRRSDSKILANYLLARVQELRELFIFVDPFGSATSLRKNIEPMRDSIEWVRDGNLLGIFPSGTVSHLHLSRREVSDPTWSPTVARLIRKTGATVVPVFFEGRNSWVFQALGMIHPRLRTILLPRELMNKQNRTFRVKIGQPVGPEKLASYETDDKLLGALRLRT